jgi:hypothetical protein
LSQTAIDESRIFRIHCRHCLLTVIIEPQLRLLCTLRGLIVYPNYRAIIVSVALITKVCCDVVGVSTPGGVPGPTSKLSPRVPAQMGRRKTEHEGGKRRQAKGETRGLRVVLRPGRVHLQ